jgi:hypothetical protein
MSTSHDIVTEDRLIELISRWLGRHIGNEELRQKIDETGADSLSSEQAGAVRELFDELGKVEPGERGHVEMVARETIEVLALGG